MTVAITRLKLSAGDLRQEAKRCRNAAAARRMLALALVREGHSREEAARHGSMDRQTLRDRAYRCIAMFKRFRSADPHQQ